MHNWYKIALEQQNVRRFDFDKADTPFYEILEEQEPFKENDTLQVYHAFRDMNDAIVSAQRGLSGQSHVPRVYSYESNNNPYGLFVTTNLDMAKNFTTFGAIMEFTCLYKELETPVWPGGSYTVQGEMAQYWDWDKLEEQREEARKKQREEARKSEYEAVKNSSRPELAQMLMSPGEFQALFVGNLNPERIDAFWVQKHGETPLITDPWIKLSREEFLEQYEYEPQKDLSGQERKKDKHMDIERKLFLPEDEFDPDLFVQRLSEDNMQSIEDLMDVIKSWDLQSAEKYLNTYIWPKQEPGLKQWLQTVL